MELIIKNLGPIKGNQQSINLSKKFFIFLGYNNSGKTYVSQLLWTIFNREKQNKFANSYYSEISLNANYIIENGLDNNQIELTQQFVDSILEQFSIFLQDEIFDVYNLERSSLKLENISISLSANINEFKAEDFTTTIGIDFGEKYSISNYLEIKKCSDSVIIEIEQKPLSEDLLANIPKEIRPSFYHALIDEQKDKCKFLLVSILQLLLKPSHYETFFLPASRAFFPVFYQYIYDIERKKREDYIKELLTLIENKRKNEASLSIQDVEKNMFRRSYTEPMNKVIESLYSLNEDSNAISFYNELLISLTQMMGGEVVLDRVEGISPVQFYFKFNNSKQDTTIPMYLASSSVNQLTLLYLYLKYWAGEKGNFLIIDEPEVNLHPENQTKLLDLLIKFVNHSSNRVLIATHSPLFADAVNNYLYIDNLRQYYNDEQIKQIIIDNELEYLYPDTQLSREDLGVSPIQK